ncbi:c-type cytochrome [Pseudomonadota bacterium]
MPPRAKGFKEDKNWEGVFVMRNYLVKLGSASVVALAMVLAPAAHAGSKVTGADYQNGQSIFENGKGNLPACNSCHGATGLGDDNLGTPRLAGQIYTVLVKQLDDYATDKRQDTTMYVMNANSKGLSKQDRRDVSAYLNSVGRIFSGKELQKASGGSDLAALRENGVDVGVSHLGKIIVSYGVAERKIPACLSCHGHNGRGVDPMYPRIGEQKLGYLVSQLKKFRDGSRANDPMGQMQAVAKSMTDEDILNVATYLTQAPQTTIGDSRIPVEHLP